MRNCPNADLPAIYVDAVACGCSAPARINCRTIPIEKYEVDCLRCPSAMEIGLCESGEGFCYMGNEVYAFQAGDVRIAFPLQRHLSRSATCATSS